MNYQISIELKNYHFIAILSFLTLLLAFNQPWVTSLDGDSIVYATISKTIAHDGNWLTPVYEFRNFFDHPPLVFWINGILFKILGSAEWVTRLFSGFSGLGTVALVYYTGARYSNKYTGFYAAIAMLLSYDFVKYLNKCRLDMPLVFFYACALYYFLKGFEGSKKGYCLCGFFTGLCFLAKGIVAAGVVLTILIFIIDQKQWGFFGNKEAWFMLFIAVIVPGIWILAQYIENGSEFFDQYFLKQVNESIKGRSRPYSPFYYLFHLFKVYWPWLPFLIHGIYVTVKEKPKSPLWRLLLIWISVVFFAFSTARFKIHYYLLPMFPAMGLLAGRSINMYLSDKIKRTGVKIVFISAITASLFIALFPFPLHHNRYPEIYKMAPYLKEIIKQGDLLIAYDLQDGINTPALFYIKDKLKISYSRDPEELKQIVAGSPKNTFLYTSDESVKKHPEVIDGFFPFIENNKMRFYSKDPNLKLSGRIY